MPVKKYKTFESAERDLWVFNPDAHYFKRAFTLLHMGIFKKNLKYPRGVFKYKTISEAQKDVDKWLHP